MIQEWSLWRRLLECPHCKGRRNRTNEFKVGRSPLLHSLLIAGATSISSLPATAQLRPDDTLGNERSRVSPDTEIRGVLSNQIDGGAHRGENLFHSFRDFNVEDGRGVYFTNPRGVTNILTRVTGRDTSDINGTLGVLGNANLFLLNPNGIVFGPNARLDIQGSFVASTGDRFEFLDGRVFSAINPQSPPLLTVSLPIGLQLGRSAETITSQGRLTTGQDLILNGGSLDLQGQLQAGRDLTLQAQNTVRVRDTPETAFEATAGRNLTVQGTNGIDILAVQHPEQTSFVSGNTLSLISDGLVSADAHFASGGDVQIRSLSGQLAQLTSFYDPIISSASNVDIAGDYSGASLLIESKGNVRIQGEILITEPDTVSDFIGEDAVLSNRPGLIIRSGQPDLIYEGRNQNSPPRYTNGDIPEGITLARSVQVVPNEQGGVVNLTAASGDITVHSIFASSSTGDGGLIALQSAGDITITSKFSDPSIDSVALGSSSLSGFLGGNGGDGGTVTLSAGGNITVDRGSISASAFLGDGGAVTLSAGDSVEARSLSTAALVNGGAITLSAGNSIQISGDIASSSESLGGDTANGGAITLSAGGNITTRDLDSASRVRAFPGNTGDAANGGAIMLLAGGDIETGILSSSSLSFSDSGDAGAIILSVGGNITTDSLFASSQAASNGGTPGNAGNGGEVRLSAGGNITTNNLDASARSTTSIVGASSELGEVGDAGSGGRITLSSRSGDIETSTIEWGSSTPGQNSGILRVNTPGQIRFTGTLRPNGADTLLGNRIAPRTIELPNSVLTRGGDFTLVTTGDLLLSDTDLVTGSRNGNSGQIQIQTPGTLTLERSRLFTSAEPGRTGSGGDITLDVRNLVLNDFSIIDTATFGAGTAGELNVTAANDITLNQSDIVSVTDSSGNAGQVTIRADGNVTLQNRSSIGTAAREGATGRGGDIDIDLQTGAFTLAGGSQLQAFTLGRGAGGDITIQAPDITVTGFSDIDGLRSGIFTSSDSRNSGNGGMIELTTLGTLHVANGGVLSAQNQSNSRGGNISITADTVQLVDGGQLITTTTRRGAAGSIHLEAQQVEIFGTSPDLQERVPSEFVCAVEGNSCSRDDNDNVEFSTRIPYVTLTGTHDDETDVYTINVQVPDTRAVFDIDNGGSANTDVGGAISISGIDTALSLVDDQGRVLARNDNASTFLGELGSNSDDEISNQPLSTGRDAYLRYVFIEPGTYILEVDKRLGAVNDPSETYSLHVSLEAPAVPGRVVETNRSSGLFAGTDGPGEAGNIRIRTDALSIQNEALLSAISTGSGNAGNIGINARQVTLNSGRISTQTETRDGGNIRLGNLDLLLMRDESSISANAGTAQAGGNGGNITFNGNFIMAVPSENSDISANAFTGSGGQVEINAQSVFGIQSRPQLTTLSDITASSEQGVAGVVTIDTPDVDPNRGLVQLPVDLVDASQLITQPCATGGSAANQANEFMVTGRGGLPPTPDEAITQDAVQVDLVSVATEEASSSQQDSEQDYSVSSPSAPIVEAAGWQVSDDGQVVLAAAPQDGTLPSLNRPLYCP